MRDTVVLAAMTMGGKVMSRVIALVLSMVWCGSMSAFAGTIYFTGSDDTKPLVKASGDLSLNTNNFLTSGTGKSTNLVTEFDEVNATTLAGTGTGAGRGNESAGRFYDCIAI